MKLYTLRSWLVSAFFIIALSHHAFAKQYNHTANTQHFNIANKQLNIIAQSPRWQRLLQLDKQKIQIPDPNFLLSLPNFSPLNELQATLLLIKTDIKIAQCKFPARFLYISKQLNNPVDIPNTFSHCKQLSLFLKAVPFTKLSLIFASETLASTTSMMGHVFFKAQGTNHLNKHVNHSIAFFSEVQNFNPFKLIYDGLISGMEGFLLVRPFAYDKNNYIEKEGRNLWQYQLKLSAYQKNLIRLHFWELKQAKINYLFQSFNCATLTLNILAIAEPKLLHEKSLFVSPVDVLKAIKKNNLISTSSVDLSSAWQALMLQQALPKQLVQQIELSINRQNINNLNSLSLHEKSLVKLYFESLQKTDPNHQIISNKLQHQITQQLPLQSNLAYINNYKNPINSHQDSQLKISQQKEKRTNITKIAYAPASHYLLNNNQQYFSESELLMGEIAINYNEQKQKVSIDSITLYSMTSLTPSLQLMPQWSNSFYLGYNKLMNVAGYNSAVINMSGGIGKAYNIHPDVLVYNLITLGGAANLEVQFAYIEPKVGIIANLLYSTKLTAEYSATFNHFNSKHTQQKTAVNLVHYLTPNISLFFSYKKEEFIHTKDNFGFGLIYSF